MAEIIMQNSKKYVICGIGAKGAIGTTIACGTRIFRMYPEKIENYLVTNIEDFPNIGPIEALDFTGWDISEINYNQAYLKHRTFFLPHLSDSIFYHSWRK